MKLKNPTRLLCAASSILALGLVSCEVEKTRDGEIPEIKVEGETRLPRYEVEKTQEGSLPDVSVEGETRLPEYNIEGPDVEVGTRRIELEVPTIDIDTPARQRAEDEETEE